MKRFYKILPGLIEAKVLRPLPTEVVPGGFEGIAAGLKRLKKKGVSGKKLVLDLATPKA